MTAAQRTLQNSADDRDNTGGQVGAGGQDMVARTETIAALWELPRSERVETLTELLVAEFKAVLLMADDEELPLECSYFDLGLTSLTLSDLKQRLEGLLGCEINANILFNSPTVTRLVEHLTAEPLAELFATPSGTA
jgi:acyl carrier protein